MNKSLAKYEAFKNIIESGKLESMSILIYNELLKQPQTLIYFREVLRMPHQTCTSALSTLEDSGWIYKEVTIVIKKKSYTLYNAETDSDKAKNRALQVEMYKKQEWINRGFKRGWIDKIIANSISQQIELL